MNAYKGWAWATKDTPQFSVVKTLATTKPYVEQMDLAIHCEPNTHSWITQVLFCK
jgi:hypothetical protein